MSNLALYCTCGQFLQLKDVRMAVIRVTMDAWATHHTGPDHRECTATVAAIARRSRSHSPVQHSPVNSSSGAPNA